MTSLPMRLSLPVLLLMFASACATTTPRERDFNSRLKAEVEETQKAKPKNAAYSEKVVAWIEKHGDLETVSPDAKITPPTFQDLIELKTILSTWPGVNESMRRMRETALAAEVELDRPDLDQLMRTEGPPFIIGLRGYRALIAGVNGIVGTSGNAKEKAGGSQHRAQQLKREIVALFSRQLVQDAQAPSYLIEVAIQMDLLKRFAELKWVPAKLTSEILQREKAFRLEFDRIKTLNRAAFEGKDLAKLSKEERLRCSAASVEELRASTHQLKLAAEIVNR